MQIHLVASPGAKQSEIGYLPDGTLKARIAAPAREGKANRELLRFLAAKLAVPASRVRLVRGAAGRHKIVDVLELDAEQVTSRLAN